MVVQLRQAVITSLILIFSLSISAQNRVDVGAINVNSSFLQSKYITKLAKKSPKLDGSPFLFENNIQAHVVPKTNVKSELLTINFDLLNDVTMLYVDGESYSIASQFLDSLLVTSEDREFIYMKIPNNPKSTLLEILVDGEYVLLRKQNAILLRPSYNPAYQAGSKNYLIKRNTQHYTLDASGKAVLLPNKYKKVLKSEDFSQDFKAKAKKLKPSLKKEDSLIDFFEKINA